MNFYLSAVDDLLRNGDDQPSIGMILCRTRRKTIAEYTLRDTSKPMGVTTYAARLPQAFRSSLPSPKQLTAEMRKVDPPRRDE